MHLRQPFTYDARGKFTKNKEKTHKTLKKQEIQDKIVETN